MDYTKGQVIRQVLKKTWRCLIFVLAPVFILPICFTSTSKIARCSYSILLMAIYWISQVVPIEATCLLPIIIFPMTGILSTEEACNAYMNSSLMLFIGGMVLASGIQQTRLHEKIALKVVLVMKTGIQWLLFSVMFTTMFISMWISNTATTTMMVTIVKEIVDVLHRELIINDETENIPLQPVQVEAEIRVASEELLEDRGNQPTISIYDTAQESREENIRERAIVSRSQSPEENSQIYGKERIKNAFYISVAYAANCGGTGSITGTAPNLILIGQMQELFTKDYGLSYGTFILFAFIPMVICTLGAWIWIVFLFLGLDVFKKRNSRLGLNRVQRKLQERYDNLGPLNLQQCLVIICFILMVFIMFFRDPLFITGWKTYFSKDVGNASVSILIAFILMAFPKSFSYKRNEETNNEQTDNDWQENRKNVILKWKQIEKFIPWSVIFLLGAGYTIARAVKVSQLNNWITDNSHWVQNISPLAVQLIFCVIVAALTEICSNTAIASLVLPAAGEIAKSINISPLFLMLPITLCTSYAFILPVATPANAIVHKTGHIEMGAMVRAGLAMNAFCILVVWASTNTVGRLIFDFSP